MMNAVVVLALLVPCVLAGPWYEMSQARHVEMDMKEGKSLDHLFEGFKLTHNKQYDDDHEERMRKSIFAANLERIHEHNALYDQGKKTYYLGINQFADMTNAEFRQFNGLKKTQKKGSNDECASFLTPKNIMLPEEVDWRKHGYVTPVKNQRQCGSCWSFSATGSLEGQHFAKTKNLVSLSEQQLVDCSGSYGNEGCNGGLMDNAFLYIKNVGGIESEDEYPYLAKQERMCNFSIALERATCKGCVDVESGSETRLQEAVASVGPVSVAIDASHQSFQLYSGGVYIEDECSSSQLDHGVLVAGYGTYKGNDYWLVKNSWGPAWGMEGYVMMARNKENQCGVATQASYPLV